MVVNHFRQKFVFGINDSISNSLYYVTETTLCYIAGNNCVILYNLDDGQQRFLCDEKDPFKKITSLAVAKSINLLLTY